MSDNNYKYFAFISYSHKDSRFVEKLHKRLEEYRLPSIIRKENPLLPKNIRPIFRDKTNLTSGMLQQELNKELEQSKFLIVICSPNSARIKSGKHWVDEEVSHFKRLGREKNIIPVIIDGEPNAQDQERECYCSALKSNSLGDEFLGIDAKKTQGVKLNKIKRILGIPDENDTEERAIDHIVARMLGLNFDDLWQRHRKQQLRKAYTRITSAMVALLIVTMGSLLVWNNYFRVTHRYFVDYVDKWGIPEGIGELSKEQLEGRYGFFKFSYRAGKLREIRYENSRGVEKEFYITSARFTVDTHQKLLYAEDGTLSETITYKNNRESVVYDQRPDLNYERVNLTERGKETSDITKMNLSFSLGEEDEAPSITSYTYSRDENGYIERQVFRKYHNSNVLAVNADGIAGFEYVLNDLGLITETKYLVAKDASTVQVGEVRGILNIVYKYDDNFNLVEESYVDKNGNKRLNQGGFSSFTSEYDDRGNYVKGSYYGVDGEPVLSKDGYASVVFEYDDRGNIIKRVYYGVEGEPVLSKDGYASVVFEYDDRGNCVKESYYGIEGEPILSKDGCASAVLEYDDRGNIIKGVYYGVEGEPILSKDGYASVVFEYDDRGNIIKRVYYGVEGEPILTFAGVASTTSEYDDSGNRIKVNFYGVEGEPVLLQNGYASRTMEYDDRGNCVKESYYGVEGEPVLSKDGYASGTIEYDDRGNCVKESYYGIEGEPVLSKDGCASAVLEYDDRGNIIKGSYYGVEGEPVLLLDGYASVTSEYDDRGNIIKGSYYGVDGEPVLLPDGYASFTSECDDRDNIIKGSYYGVDGEPVLSKDGYASRTSEYDDRGNCVKESYYGVDGEPVLLPDGYASVTSEYDDRGNIIKGSYYGVDGEPVLLQDGYASWTAEYDENGNLITLTQYGVDGEIFW